MHWYIKAPWFVPRVRDPKVEDPKSPLWLDTEKYNLRTWYDSWSHLLNWDTPLAGAVIYGWWLFMSHFQWPGFGTWSFHTFVLSWRKHSYAQNMIEQWRLIPTHLPQFSPTAYLRRIPGPPLQTALHDTAQPANPRVTNTSVCAANGRNHTRNYPNS